MIQQQLIKWETNVSYFAGIPGLNLIVGPCKIVAATVHTVAALIFLIVLSPSMLCGKGKNLRNKAFSHLVHASANIIAGVLETIPILSTIMAYVRFSNIEKKFNNINATRFIGYKNIGISSKGRWFDI